MVRQQNPRFREPYSLVSRHTCERLSTASSSNNTFTGWQWLAEVAAIGMFVRADKWLCDHLVRDLKVLYTNIYWYYICDPEWMAWHIARASLVKINSSCLQVALMSQLQMESAGRRGEANVLIWAHGSWWTPTHEIFSKNISIQTNQPALLDIRLIFRILIIQNPPSMSHQSLLEVFCTYDGSIVTMLL